MMVTIITYIALLGPNPSQINNPQTSLIHFYWAHVGYGLINFVKKSNSENKIG